MTGGIVPTEGTVNESSRNEIYDYGRIEDEELVSLAQDGDSRAFSALLERHQDSVRIKARSYFLMGADYEDIVQEGMIGLFKAIRDYRDDRQASFKAFAEICVTRQIITAVKTATRQKHIPLNSYVSLSNPVYPADDSDRVFLDFIATDPTEDPVEVVISDEEIASLKDNFGKMLSDLETEVLHRYMEGDSYQDIADELDRHVKSIDNALQRIKRKVERHLEHRECLAEGIIPAAASNTRAMSN